jgi:GNAT superfamily N-acetyltransferase
MERDVLLALYDREQRIDIEYPGLTKEVAGGVVRFSGAAEHDHGNFVLYGRFAEQRTEEVIQEQIAYYARLGRPFEWRVFSHDAPPDLRERLMAQGFKPRLRDAVMVMNVRTAHPCLLEPVEVDVRRVTDPAKLEVMIDLLAAEYGVDFSGLAWLLEEDLRERPSYSSVYLAYVEGQPAGAAWIQFPARSQFATLWGGTVMRKFRGRGLYSALLAARVQEAIHRGYGLLVFEATNETRPLAEKFGFDLLTYAHSCMWLPHSRRS